jgi:hypothetical protein
VVNQHSHSCPFGELCPLAVQDVDELVDGDEDLTDVADEEEEDDSKEDQGDPTVATASRLFLLIGEKAIRIIKQKNQIKR